MRPHHFGYLALVVCIASMAGCSSCKKGKDVGDAAPEAAASVAMSAAPMDSASAAPMDSAATAPSSEPAEATSGVKAAGGGGGALPSGLPPRCADTKAGTNGIGAITLTPTGGGGLVVHAKEANATCTPTDDKHYHCKWTMLPGGKNSGLKNFSVTKGWTLVNKDAKAPNRYFYGSNYFGSELSCHETP